MENGTCSDDPWKFWGANPIEQMAAQLPPESQAFLKGLIYDWNVVFVPSGNQVRGGTFHASIALRDRGLLTDGFRVLIQVQDKNGNYNAVEKEGTLEKNLAQKAGEWVADAVNAVVRGFIAWLVETIGTIAGIIIGILAGIIKNIIDMIVGLVDMIVHLPEMLGMIGQIGSIFSNIGQVFLAMVDGWTNEAEWVMPASWAAQCAKPAATQVLELVMGKFNNTSSENGTCARTEYIKNYVIGAIAGFIIGMLIGGGIVAALAKLKTIKGFTDLTKNVGKALDNGADAAKASKGAVKRAATAAGDDVSGGGIHVAKLTSRLDLDEAQTKFLKGAVSKNKKNNEHLKDFANRAEADDVVKRTHALSKTGKMDEAEAQKLLDKAIQASKTDKGWKGSLNEIEMFEKYADDIPNGHHLKVNPRRGQGDALVFDEADRLVARLGRSTGFSTAKSRSRDVDRPPEA